MALDTTSVADYHQGNLRSGGPLIQVGRMSKHQPRFIDLFAGCGGLSQGFKQAGWSPVFAVEQDRAAAESYRANLACPVWAGSIEDLIPELERGRLSLPDIDAVIGGPPCQGFSPLGRMSAKPQTRLRHSNMNDLWSCFLRIVEILRPGILVTENVPQFIRSPQFSAYIAEAERLGYWVSFGVLKAEEFGVPQKRRRAFCIGGRLRLPILPSPNSKRATVRDAIGHLPLEPDGINWHIGRSPRPRSVQRYRLIPPGGNRFDLVRLRPDLAPACWRNKKTGTTDVFGRLRWEEPAGTIRTEFFKPEKGRYLHPQADRPLTHREAAALQTFPDSFEFVGSKTQVARQIGEAVPPRLAAEVARAALANLDTSDTP